MPLETVIALVAVLVAIAGFFYGRRDKRDTDQGSYAVMAEKIKNLEESCRRLQHFNENTLPKLLDGIKSDVFGTIANYQASIEKRLDRIERVLNGKLRGTE